MKKTIGCLHAHYSNIAHIENALASDEREFVHFVDPGLMSRIAWDSSFDDAKAKGKAVEQIEWISHANVDAILITCTNYIALLEDEHLHSPIPFTNPATVDGTMRRLYDFASAHGRPSGNMDARVIDNAFELLMQGKKEQYAQEVSTYIKKLLASEKDKKISVAQLSMAETAYQLERELRVSIGNPLHSLIAYFDSLTFD